MFGIILQLFGFVFVGETEDYLVDLRIKTNYLIIGLILIMYIKRISHCMYFSTISETKIYIYHRRGTVGAWPAMCFALFYVLFFTIST